MNRKGNAAILGALIISVIIAGSVVVLMQLSRNEAKRGAKLVSSIEGFYAAEILSWHNFRRATNTPSALACSTALVGDACPSTLGFRQDDSPGLTSSTTPTSYDPSSYTGGALNAATTKSKAASTALFRRIAESSHRTRTDGGTQWCGDMKPVKGIDTREVCIAQLPPCTPWTATSTTNAPAKRKGHIAVWTGDTGNAATSNKMIIWGGEGTAEFNTGAIYDLATNTWTTMPVPLSGGTTQAKGRFRFAAAWTGDTGDATTSHRLMIWGGQAGTCCSNWSYPNDGYIYNPATNTWSKMVTTGTVPSGRTYPVSAWFDKNSPVAFRNKMLIGGGCDPGNADSCYQSDSYDKLDYYLFDPRAQTDSSVTAWTRVADATIKRFRFSSYLESSPWSSNTGNSASQFQLLFWGGLYGTSSTRTLPTVGERYYAETNSWANMATANQPTPRVHEARSWVGGKLAIWGGCGKDKSGNFPGTGSANVTCWSFDSVVRHGATGGLYDPATNTWSAMNTSGAPDPRYHHNAIGVGNRMMVWGGCGDSKRVSDGGCGSYLNDGALYQPSTNTWVGDTCATNAPAGRLYHSMVYTGVSSNPAVSNKVIVWGGSGAGDRDLNTGAIYSVP